MNKLSSVILIFALPVIHLQYLNQCYVTTICNTETKATKIISEFWHKTTGNCEPDTKNLYEMRKKLQEYEENYHYDFFNELLSAHINTSLMELLFRQIMNKISTKTLKNAEPHSHLDEIVNDLYTEDRKFILKIWQQVLDAIAVFMDMHSIIQHILLNEKNNEFKLDMLHYLLYKYENQYSVDQRVMPTLVYAITTVGEEISNGNYNIKAYETLKEIINTKLPKPLATLYLSQSFYNVSLLNRQHNKFIFPDVDGGPSDNKRFILTLVSNLPYNIKGVFKVEINAEGMVAFSAFYKPVYRYIVAEDHTALICLNCVELENGSQWWQVLWPIDNKEFVIFQNTATGELLCATDLYMENWVLISTLAAEEHRNNLACHWKVSMNKKKN